LPDPRPAAGLRLALTLFTVAPLRPAPVTREGARRAMGWAAPVGALLGALLGAAAVGLRAAHAPALVTGAAVVAAGAALTRGLHLDGLADTVDGLGSYAGRDRALEIMRGPEVGPFGVAAIALAVLVQAASIGGIAARPGSGLRLFVAVVTATAAGRLAAAVSCRRGVPAARDSGLGALVAGVLGWPALAAGALALAALALAAVPGRPWQGPAALGAALLGGAVLERHAVRRLGGITGDVLGALVEITVSVSYLALSLG
jgi:adenosylcobinamide-GDP ribazoletransferase